MGGACSTYRVEERYIQGLVGRREGKGPHVRPGGNGMIILKWVLKNWDVRVRTGFIWLRIGTGGGHL